MLTLKLDDHWLANPFWCFHWPEYFFLTSLVFLQRCICYCEKIKQSVITATKESICEEWLVHFCRKLITSHLVTRCKTQPLKTPGLLQASEGSADCCPHSGFDWDLHISVFKKLISKMWRSWISRLYSFNRKSISNSSTQSQILQAILTGEEC